MDADGATDEKEILPCIEKLEKVKKNGLAICIGDRKTVTEEVKRTVLRELISTIGGKILKLALGFQVSDTQCGFKMFTREAAELIFPTQHLRRWAFDIEVLLLANLNGVPIGELPVAWQEIEGSHLNVLVDSAGIFRDMITLRTLYALGVWRKTDLSF